MAREAGDTDPAVELLQRAHKAAPAEPNRALELAFALESQHGRTAARIYEEILSKDPDSRPALLGLARVARGQYRQDAEALNGLAWVAPAERNREEARAGFQGVLAQHPQNQGAQVGLSKVNVVYNYVLDVNGAFVADADQPGGAGAPR